MKQYIKRYLSMLMAVIMTAVMIPAGAMSQVRATGAEDGGITIKPSLHYDMSHSGTVLSDISGNHKDGTLQGITDSDFSEDGAGGKSLQLGSNKYVEIPAGVITGETFAIEAVYIAPKKSNSWLFTLGTTVASWPNVKNCLFVSPYSAQSGYDGKMLAAIQNNKGGNEGGELRYPTGTLLQGNNNDQENIVTVIFNNGNVTYYLNGKQSEVTRSGYKIQDILAGHQDKDVKCGYIGKSLYDGDPYFEGTLKDFKIYNQPSTEHLLEEAEGKLESVMLAKNDSAENITSDLAFPKELNGISLTWTPGKYEGQDVVGADGKILWSGAQTAAVDVQVTGTCGGEQVLQKTYSINVVGTGQAEYDALTLRNTDNIRGNITLPEKGEKGSPITWESSNEAVIYTKDKKNTGYDKTPAGVVHRQEEDTKVTLTATLQQGSSERKKEFEVTVKAKPQIGEKTDYLFAYFIGDGKETDGQKQEQIFLAASRDGLNWGELNNAQPVLSSTMGEEGLRDPYIIRSAEGDKFYMIATDLQIAKGGTDVWGNAQKNGSQAVMVWESEDLVNWGEQRMVTISAEIGAGCTWAPEAFYDDQTGEYVVFWASKVKGKNYDKQRLYYCKTRDFYTFTKPKLWIEKTFSVIDTTVVRDDDGTYYRFTKNENDGAKYIFMEKSNSLLKGWTSVPSATLQAETGREGPCCFKLSEEDMAEAGGRWAVLLDDFGGIGYYPMVTDDLQSAKFSKLTTARLPKVKKPRHGTVLNITAEEYERVTAAYGATPFLTPDSVPDLVGAGYTLPNRADINYAGEIITADMTWDKEKLDTPGKVTVAGTISGSEKEALNGKTVSKEIEVVSASPDTIYFIDSGVGSWNEKRPESSMYKTVGKIAELRNTIPDQTYSAENGWGIVNDAEDVANRKNETDDVYANGWYAKSNKNCEYIVPLENGSYKATGYFAEWWNQSRPVKFYVEYEKEDGTAVKSEEKTISLSGSNSKQTAEIEFTVEGVTDKAEVHFLAVKGGSADPVISGLSIEKKLTEEEKAAAEAAKAKLEEVELSSEGAVTLKAGETADITLSYPEGYEEAVSAAHYTSSVTHSSNNTRAVDVDAEGRITAKAAGTAVITTRAAISSKVSKSFTTKVTVAGKQVEKVTLNKTTLNMKENTTSRLRATVTPADAVDRGITWTSSNEETAVVSGGLVTAKAEGEAVITAKTKNGTEASCKVTVGDENTPQPVQVESVTLNKTSLTLAEGESETLTAEVLPKEADQKVSWKSDRTDIASVDENGRVTAVKEGTAKITAAAGDKTASCTVTVKPKSEQGIPVEKVTLNKSRLVLTVGSSETLRASVLPEEASQNVSWVSKAPGIASVNANGKVTAVKKGTAVITASAGGKTASCTVTVNPKPIRVSKVKLNKTKLTLGVKEKFTLKPAITPKNASNQKVKWTCSKKGIVSVSSKGVVTAKKQGSVKVTATVDGKKAVCTITVKKAPNKVSLGKTKVTLKKGRTYKIAVKLPKNTASNKITYSSNKKSIATVSAKGVVKAVKKGKAVITVSTFNKKKVKLTVTVK